MMTSKEWAIHKILDDANPMPKKPMYRGNAKSTFALVLYFMMLETYTKRPIHVENIPIKISKGAKL